VVDLIGIALLLPLVLWLNFSPRFAKVGQEA